MLILLSPAKNMDESPLPPMAAATAPAFGPEAALLAEQLRKLGKARIAKLMDLNPKLAELNAARFQAWEEAILKPAAFLYDGEVYRALGASSLDADDLRFAQRHLRLLSGLYGVLRPLDLIAPHRLEMGTKLAMGKGRKDLYAFWGTRIADAVNHALEDMGGETVLNLASAEYFRSVGQGRLKGRVITPQFKERSASGLRTVMMHAKHQRGAMARWIIRHRLHQAEGIKGYDVDGYRYSPGDSTADEWLFVR
ncbi:MAG: peroxide stress protein YaaA [Bacteroidetes bacterium]|nr:peroxide stress protein YaaA [Bacteroidota bacterium]